ncbi:MAG: RHS repeat-associated core domain-containing protein, partial [Cyclobacteriaceae bacterium]
KKAAGKHEFLEANFYIEKVGHMEAFLVNETETDVWFDDFRVETRAALVVQEDHFDPWGLALSGLEYRADERKENRYGFNGKEKLPDAGLDLYDFGARLYDPAIGRWMTVDPLGQEREWLSPYNFVQNNPMLRIDPDGMLDEYNYNLETGDFEWVSDRGGDERQYVNVVNNEGDVLTDGSVPGNTVYAYKLRDGVALTTYDANLDDRAYNIISGYEYTLSEFRFRNKVRGVDDVIGRFLAKTEREGKAIPLTYSEEEKLYGHTVMRLKMAISSIDQSFDAMPSFTLGSVSPKKFGVPIKGTGDFNMSPLKGNKGVSALTNSSSWNKFLQTRKGVYSGKGWQKRAAADYYNSSFYKK